MLKLADEAKFVVFTPYISSFLALLNDRRYQMLWINLWILQIITESCLSKEFAIESIEIFEIKNIAKEFDKFVKNVGPYSAKKVLSFSNPFTSCIYQTYSIMEKNRCQCTS